MRSRWAGVTDGVCTTMECAPVARFTCSEIWASASPTVRSTVRTSFTLGTGPFTVTV